MKIKLISPFHPDASELIAQSTKYMASLYPDDLCHLEDAASLGSDDAYFVGVFEATSLVGIGAVKLRKHDIAYGEIKRVYIDPRSRGKGLAKPLMQTLEDYLFEKGIFTARLETGVKQPTAISLYKSIGYKERSPYGTYQKNPLSVFMEKQFAE